MKDIINKLNEFNRAFGVYANETPTGVIPGSIRELRVKLLTEELEEYNQAALKGDVVEVADALTDLLYVLVGTYYAHGLQYHAEALFDEVHRSNMSKLDETGQPVLREDGKVIKSARFFSPVLDLILREPVG